LKRLTLVAENEPDSAIAIGGRGEQAMTTDTSTDHLQALADALRERDHTADITRDHAGRTTLKAGHPAVPAILTVSIRCGVFDGGRWSYLWEWGESIDLPIDDTGAVADRVAAVLGVTA
jgi:hypothetical protein